MKITDLLTTEQKAAALDVERRWLNWLRDPDHNVAPNPKASATTAQREYKAAGGEDWRSVSARFMERLERASVRRRQARQATSKPAEPLEPLGNTTMLTRARVAMQRILKERQDDPEPDRTDTIGRMYWARREEKRQDEMSHWRQYLP